MMFVSRSGSRCLGRQEMALLMQTHRENARLTDWIVLRYQKQGMMFSLSHPRDIETKA